MGKVSEELKRAVYVTNVLPQEVLINKRLSIIANSPLPKKKHRKFELLSLTQDIKVRRLYTELADLVTNKLSNTELALLREGK